MLSFVAAAVSLRDCTSLVKPLNGLDALVKYALTSSQESATACDTLPRLLTSVLRLALTRSDPQGRRRRPLASRLSVAFAKPGAAPGPRAPGACAQAHRLGAVLRPLRTASHGLDPRENSPKLRPVVLVLHLRDVRLEDVALCDNVRVAAEVVGAQALMRAGGLCARDLVPPGGRSSRASSGRRSRWRRRPHSSALAGNRPDDFHAEGPL